MEEKEKEKDIIIITIIWVSWNLQIFLHESKNHLVFIL